MGGGRGFLRKPKWLKSLTKDNSVKVLAGGEHAAGNGAFPFLCCCTGR